MSVLFGLGERPEINLVSSAKAVCDHLRIDLKNPVVGVVCFEDLSIEYITGFYFLDFLNQVDVFNYRALSDSKSNDHVPLVAAD